MSLPAWVVTAAILLPLVASACTPQADSIEEPSRGRASLFPAGPLNAAEQAFQLWAQSANVPYRNPHFEIISNDGTYATALVTAELRPSRESEWLEHSADLECRHVGGNWSCLSLLSFSLSDRQKHELEQQAAYATATVQAKETAEAQLLQLVEVTNGERSTENRNFFESLPCYVSREPIGKVEVQLRNLDVLDLTVVLGLYVGEPGPLRSHVTPEPAEVTIVVPAGKSQDYEFEFDFSKARYYMDHPHPEGKKLGCDVIVRAVN